MRPPRIQRSTIQYPLDEILATPAHVRLLRVILFDTSEAVSVTDAARMSGLSTTGARNSFETLETLGAVVRVGTGRAQKYGPAPGNPYLTLFRQLFEREHQQYEDLLRALRSAVALPETREAWIRDFPVKSQQAIEVDVVAAVKSVSWIESEIRSRMIETETRWNIIVEINMYTRADRPDIPANAIMLWTSGESTELLRSPELQTRSESEDRSRKMAHAIADLLKSDPSLIKRTLRYTNRLLQEGQGTADKDLGDWRQLLESYSNERLRDLLVSESSRAMRLRRSMPFFSVLTSEERDRVLESMESMS